jgi:TetR/AcrR family acrAB operon transcriptional repressor
MPRRTKEDALATRHALLDAAELLFQQRGVSRTSLQDIAQAAGVTRGAVYHHFEDKAALFDAMMERVRLPLEDAELQAATTPDQAWAALETMLVEVFRRIADSEQVHRVFEIAIMKVEYVDEMAALRERHKQAKLEHREAMLRGLRRAGLSPARAETAARGLQALVVGLIHSWMLEQGSFSLLVVGRTAVKAHLAGLRAGT